MPSLLKGNTPRLRRLLATGSLLTAAFVPFAKAAEPSLGEHYWRGWLGSVAPLLSDGEQRQFEQLDSEAEREAFRRDLWLARPDLLDRWLADRRAVAAEPALATLPQGDPRARMLALFGLPEKRTWVECKPPALLPRLFPLEIWRYREVGGEGRARRESMIYRLFVHEGDPSDPGERVRSWSRASPVEELFGGEARSALRHGSLGLADYVDSRAGDGSPCLDAAAREELKAALALAQGDAEAATQSPFLARLETSYRRVGPARPVAAFPGRITRLHLHGDGGAPALGLRLEPERSTLLAAFADLPPPALSLAWQLNVEILREGAPVDEVLYPLLVARPPETSTAGTGASTGSGTVPLFFSRPLPAGSYEVVLRLQAEGRLYRARFAVEVDPSSAETESVMAARGTALPLIAGRPTLLLAATSLSINPPPPGLLVGRQLFSASVWGTAAAVDWLLDGTPAVRATEPPFGVAIELGQQPKEHRLAAVARNARGQELARDEVVLNAGPHGFRVRLLEPRSGASVRGEVAVRAAVEVPEGEGLDHLDVYVGDRLAERLTTPPWATTVAVAADGSLGFLRAVAVLASGASTEATAVLNSPASADLMAVDLVQLYLAVSDRRGRPIEDLAAGEVAVSEDGEPQVLQQFERVEQVPLDVVLLLDVSDSMQGKLGAAARAAEGFLTRVLQPQDQAALVLFNQMAELHVPFTHDGDRLRAGLGSLEAEGGTAIWDAVALSLYHFGGLSGRRALVVLSDGADYHSSLSFASIVEYAQRMEAKVYAIGLLPLVNPISSEGKEARDHLRKLEELAAATGGRAFAIETVSQLGSTYETIAHDLRSQYLATYPSSHAGSKPGYRQVKVEVRRPGARVRTMQGYYAD